MIQGHRFKPWCGVQFVAYVHLPEIYAFMFGQEVLEPKIYGFHKKVEQGQITTDPHV